MVLKAGEKQGRLVGGIAKLLIPAFPRQITDLIISGSLTRALARGLLGWRVPVMQEEVSVGPACLFMGFVKRCFSKIIQGHRIDLGVAQAVGQGPAKGYSRTSGRSPPLGILGSQQ